MTICFCRQCQRINRCLHVSRVRNRLNNLLDKLGKASALDILLASEDRLLTRFTTRTNSRHVCITVQQQAGSLRCEQYCYTSLNGYAAARPSLCKPAVGQESWVHGRR